MPSIAVIPGDHNIAKVTSEETVLRVSITFENGEKASFAPGLSAHQLCLLTLVKFHVPQVSLKGILE